MFLDRSGSTEKACRLIREAGRNGAPVIGFPERFIPAHPVWYHHHAATRTVANRLSVELPGVSVVPHDVWSADWALLLVIQTNSSHGNDASCRPSSYAGAGRGRSPSIARRISRNNFLGTATSAIWKMT